MQIVIYTLLNYINCCIKQDTEYNVAKCLLLNIRKLKYLSLEETAEMCNVSVSTLNRFCRTIGFINFSTIKRLMQNHDLPFDYTSLAENRGNSPDYLEKIIFSLEKVESIDISYFQHIANIIDNAHHVKLLGYGDFFYEAEYFQNIMLYHGLLLEIVNQNEVFDPRTIKENDVLIITSLSGGYVMNLVSALKLTKCKKVLITKDKKDMPDIFDVVIEVGKNDDMNLNKYIIMRVYEKIITSYFHKKSMT